MTKVSGGRVSSRTWQSDVRLNDGVQVAFGSRGMTVGACSTLCER